MKDDPFQILGIAPSATEAEIRAAWRARVREHPPERDSEGFERVRAAYEQVRDPAAWARHLLDAPSPEFPPPRRVAPPVPDVGKAARELLRYLMATGELHFEEDDEP